MIFIFVLVTIMFVIDLICISRKFMSKLDYYKSFVIEHVIYALEFTGKLIIYSFFEYVILTNLLS